MTGRSAFSLRTVTPSSAAWYLTVPAGWALCAWALVEMLTTPRVALAGSLAMAAAMVVFLELLPLVHGRGHDPEGVVMSTAFVFALMFTWGAAPAILAVAIAAVAADLRKRKNWWKTVFNAAQYSVSVAAGYGAMLAFGLHPTLSSPALHTRLAQLLVLPAVWVAYFVVNFVLVLGVLSFSRDFLGLLVKDFVHYTIMTFAVFALSPLIVVVIQTEWLLLPLLLIPLLLLRYTAQMSLEREHAAAHDTLTQLPNRQAVKDALADALETYRRDGTQFGLLFIDLDDFKRVNDTLGHQVGDELLVQFADRLRGAVDESVVLARLGGDEFAVIVQQASPAETYAVAERLLASVAEPLDLHGLQLAIELSIGVATCPEDGVDGATLMRRADVAMYLAKSKRSGVETYSAERDDNSADRLQLLSDLRRALAEGEVELHYQPKVSADDHTLLGVEALVRWRHPERGYIPPDAFVPLAERSGVMPLLTERVITLAVQQLRSWQRQGIRLPIAVNVSPTDLDGEALVTQLTDVFRDGALPPGLLQLEITERLVDHHLEEARHTLAVLRTMGVTVSLDDFGTGYSSLMRLHALDVDEIKIDHVFVKALADNPRQVGIVRALIDLAHALSLPAIAEGVETAEQEAVLVRLGCDGIQGYYIAAPMSAPAVTAWITRHAEDGRTVSPLRAGLPRRQQPAFVVDGTVSAAS